jgi:hypothetical protein
MDASAIEAGKAFLKYVVDDSELEGQLGKIAKKLGKFGEFGNLVTAPLIAAFTTAAFTIAEVGDELHVLSERTGVSVENLSE